MRIEIGRTIRNFVIFVAILMVMVPGVLASEPSYSPPSGAITVDGNSGEWDLNADLFAYMTEAENHGVAPYYVFRSKLYLRYDCTEGVLYAMVLLEPDTVINDSKSENLFIKVNTTTETEYVNNGIELVNGNTGYDGFAPDLHYIIVSNKIIGWEASAPLAAGTYRICVRTQVDTSTGVKTSGTGSNQYGIPLKINCGTTPIPEFPTVALPVAAIIGLMFLFGRKRDL